MYPAQSDLQLYRGDYFEMLLRLREGDWVNGAYEPGNYMDIEGWVGKAEIRATVDAGTVLASFHVAVLDVGTPETMGSVQLYLDNADTAVLTAATAVWDFQLTDPGGRVFTYLRGKVTIEKDVTR